MHPNIVGFKRALLTQTHLCIVMELLQKATLIDFVLAQPGKVATEQQARVAIQQMLCAVAHSHAQGIVHRDLKLCNSLLVNAAVPDGVPILKVCDFGYSKAMSVATAASTFVGALERLRRA